MSVLESIQTNLNLVAEKTAAAVRPSVTKAFAAVGIDMDMSATVTIDDPMFSALYANLLKIEALLKQLKLAALDFLKSLDILNRSATTLCDGIQKFSSADDQYKLGKAVSPYRLAMNEAASKGLAHTCRGKIELSLQRKVLNPIEQNLRLFQDIKERIAHRSVNNAEVRNIKADVALVRSRSNTAAERAAQDGATPEHQARATLEAQKVAALEDSLAEAERVHATHNAGLFQELADINEQRFKLVLKLFQAYKEVQFEYFTTAVAVLGPEQGEGEEAPSGAIHSSDIIETAKKLNEAAAAAEEATKEEAKEKDGAKEGDKEAEAEAEGGEAKGSKTEGK